MTLTIMKTKSKFPSNEVIDELSVRYRSGDTHAGEELLGSFDGYLGKYFRLLRYGSWIRGDPEITKFMHRFRWYRGQDAGGYIRDFVAKLDDDDIKQELVLIFLESVLKPGNITMWFRRLLYRWLNWLRRDVSQNSCCVPDIEGYTTPVEEGPCFELDAKWVEGGLVSPPFHKLTPLHRLILMSYYQQGMSHALIAERLGMGRAAVKRKREEAERLLAQWLEAGEE